jgi:hypothetical protein
LKFLISKGANPFAVDNEGMSVSDYAYNKRYDQYRFLGSYRGDLWDAALAQSGLDLPETRQNQPRRPNYTTPDKRGACYQRKDFTRLWEGCEDLCPYYDDPRVWPPGARIVEIDMDDGTESVYDAELEDNTELEDAAELEDGTDYENESNLEDFEGSRAENHS